MSSALHRELWKHFLLSADLPILVGGTVDLRLFASRGPRDCGDEGSLVLERGRFRSILERHVDFADVARSPFARHDKALRRNIAGRTKSSQCDRIAKFKCGSSLGGMVPKLSG
jgi:hypothetical protein